MKTTRFVLCCSVFAFAPVFTHADTLASFTDTGLSTPANYLGESFQVSGSGSYNNIVFEFLQGGSTPYAVGTAFLLTQEYTGSPQNLSSSTPGYVGSAAANSGSYDFASSVVLTAGNTYYLYENALAPNGITGSYSSGPEYYYSVTASDDFTGQQGGSADFQVTGTPIAATPEPSSFALLFSGIVGFKTVLGRRRRV